MDSASDAPLLRPVRVIRAQPDADLEHALATPGFEPGEAKDLGLELVARPRVAREALLGAVREVELLPARGGIPEVVDGDLLAAHGGGPRHRRPRAAARDFAQP